jgi:hypothetical protein
MSRESEQALLRGEIANRHDPSAHVCRLDSAFARWNDPVVDHEIKRDLSHNV